MHPQALDPRTPCNAMQTLLHWHAASSVVQERREAVPRTPSTKPETDPNAHWRPARVTAPTILRLPSPGAGPLAAPPPCSGESTTMPLSTSTCRVKPGLGRLSVGRGLYKTRKFAGVAVIPIPIHSTTKFLRNYSATCLWRRAAASHAGTRSLLCLAPLCATVPVAS
jgi:hypothetical protein